MQTNRIDFTSETCLLQNSRTIHRNKQKCMRRRDIVSLTSEVTGNCRRLFDEILTKLGEASIGYNRQRCHHFLEQRRMTTDESIDQARYVRTSSTYTRHVGFIIFRVYPGFVFLFCMSMGYSNGLCTSLILAELFSYFCTIQILI